MRFTLPRPGLGSGRAYHPPARAGHPDAARSRGLHDDELQVLAFTSTVNGRLYLPWEDDESKENFKIPGMYKDIDGRCTSTPLATTALFFSIR